MRIGEVHSMLRQEFPTIELSKIRYYEDKGLVRPSRSRKGYRLYTENDVECLREAFRLAQQEFVPLRVVRQRLIEQGLLSEEPFLAPTSAPTRVAASDAAVSVVTIPVSRTSLAAVPETPSLRDVGVEASTVSESNNFVSTGGQFSREDFLAAAQVSEAQLHDLEYFGFLTSREVAGRPAYEECDLIIAKRFRALGERGVDVRHLQGLKRTVERQVDLLNDLTAPLRRPASQTPDQNVIDETRKVADDLSALRAALLTRALQAYFGH